MSITRRQFLLGMTGTATGLVVPTYLAKATQFLQETGNPLILPPNDIVTELYAEDRHGDFYFHLDDSGDGPPPMTYREYALLDYDDIGEFMDSWDVSEEELDEEIDQQFVIDHWARSDSPDAQAFYLLDDLGLMPENGDQSAVGNLIFVDGHGGEDYRAVYAPDPLSVSLLQARLNELDAGIHIVLEGGAQ